MSAGHLLTGTAVCATVRPGENALQIGMWGVIFGCLLFAGIMDLRTCRVYRFIWWISGAAAMVLLWESRAGRDFSMWGLFAYCLLQELFFGRMYGRADCHAFCVCAAAGTSVGFTYRDYLLHMLLAFGMLAVVQLAKHNVNRKGNLTVPVPFLPYISLSFLILLFLFSQNYGCAVLLFLVSCICLKLRGA